MVHIRLLSIGFERQFLQDILVRIGYLAKLDSVHRFKKMNLHEKREEADSPHHCWELESTTQFLSYKPPVDGGSP